MRPKFKIGQEVLYRDKKWRVVKVSLDDGGTAHPEPYYHLKGIDSSKGYTVVSGSQLQATGSEGEEEGE